MRTLSQSSLQDTVLELLREEGAPVRFVQLIDKLSTRADSVDDIEARRAIWSLIARHLIQLTSDWHLLRIE